MHETQDPILQLMNVQIAVTLAILAVSVILFVTNKLGPDIIALLTVVALILTRSLSAADALAGFGNPAVITIASIFLVTAGLTNTGVAAWIGRRLLQIAGGREARLVVVTMSVAATLSLAMNNVASASVLLPALSNICRQTGVKPSKLLIPLSFGTLLGGMATLFTTVNVLVNDALISKGIRPFTLWDFFRIGSILTVAGIAFMATLGRKLLPDYPAKPVTPVRFLPEELPNLYHVPEQMFEVRILAGSPLDGKTVGQSRLGRAYDFNVMGIVRSGRIKLAPGRDEVLRAGDRLMIEGEAARLQQSQEGIGLVVEPEDIAKHVELAGGDIGIVEVVVSPHADIVGRSLRDLHFREKWGLTVIAILRQGQPVRQGVADLPLRFGDALLVQGPRGRLKLLRSERNLIMLDESETAALLPGKAPWAVTATVLMLLLAGIGVLKIATASLVAAMVMVLSGALTIEEGYQAIEWKAVVMVGGMLSMGVALEKSAAAALISHNLLYAIGPLGPFVVMAGFYLVSLFLAQVMSGATTAVLIAPIGLSAAQQMNVSVYPILMAVVLGASSAFLTPVSHPANVLVMGPGGYKFSDYGRVGGYLTILIFILAMVLVPFFWPL